MRICCPYCGERGNGEFTYYGDAEARRRPDTPIGARLEGAILDQWMNYVYWRDNPAGEHRELWYHGACRAWLMVTRNVSTHQILGIEPARTASAGEASR